MNRYTYTFILIMIMVAHTATAQFTMGASTGIMSGTNRVIVDYELVSTTPYVIYKDVYANRKSVSNSVSLQAGYMFKNLHLFAGYNVGTNNTNPAFIQANAGWNMMFGESNFGIMPYTGVAYRLRNLEQRDYGFTYTGGLQFQKWIFSDKAPTYFIFFQSEYSYKHISFSIGIKGLFEKKNY